jgi:hypothetical protein
MPSKVYNIYKPEVKTTLKGEQPEKRGLLPKGLVPMKKRKKGEGKGSL